MNDHEVPRSVCGENPPRDDALEGAFVPTEAGAEVLWLRRELEAERAESERRKADIRALQRKLARCNADRSRFRPVSELAIRAAVADIEAGLKVLVANAPRYEDEEDSST